jgi:hypothetical protein
MIDVLVARKTARLIYTLDFIFKSRGIAYQLMTDLDAFNSSTNIKLHYGNLNVEAPSLNSCELLFEEEVKVYDLEKSEFGGEECMQFGDVTDPVGSIFFILSRYEEYLPHDEDEHGRFPFKESVLAKWGWTQKAMCDRWAIVVLRHINLEDEVTNATFKFIPTFDIDNTYAYKLKSGKRKWLSIAKDVLNFNIPRIVERKKVNAGEKDPYDTFDRIEEVAKIYENTLIFWLVGELAPKDRNLSTTIGAHQELIQKMDFSGAVNLHPSYASNGEVTNIINEKERLESILGHSIDKSRQHFLRFKTKETLSNLEVSGFKHDYSMGFAEMPGFRCGTARAHHRFDLNVNSEMDLTIHPFVYMDGSLNEYLKLSIQESKKLIAQLYEEVAVMGGDFIFIWHNETIGDYGKWKGWSEVLNYTLNLKNE